MPPHFSVLGSQSARFIWRLNSDFHAALNRVKHFNPKQAGAELCQAQGQFGLAWFGLYVLKQKNLTPQKNFTPTKKFDPHKKILDPK